MTALIVIAFVVAFFLLAARSGVDSRHLDPRNHRRTSI
jgi:hypothetical protein